MADVAGEILVFAVGIAISPIPIIAVILMLFSARARINGPAFLLGWVAGITVEVMDAPEEVRALLIGARGSLENAYAKLNGGK